MPWGSHIGEAEFQQFGNDLGDAIDRGAQKANSWLSKKTKRGTSYGGEAETDDDYDLPVTGAWEAPNPANRYYDRDRDGPGMFGFLGGSSGGGGWFGSGEPERDGRDGEEEEHGFLFFGE